MLQEKKLTLVFDIDGTLADSSKLNDKAKLYLLRKSMLIHCLGYEFQILPGVLELMSYLYSLPYVKVVFFSAGIKERNVDLVRELLIRALGWREYREVEKSLIILSREDLTPTDSKKDAMLCKTFGIESGKFKKDITKALDNKVSELPYTILIDDNSSNVCSGQTKNFLRCLGSTCDYMSLLDDTRYFASEIEEAYFADYNSIFYIAGVLSHCASLFEKGEDIGAFLFNLNFRPSTTLSFHGYQLDYTSTENRAYFNLGLQVLRTVNPRLNYVTKRDYKEIVTLPAGPAEKVALEAARAYTDNSSCLVM